MLVGGVEGGDFVCFSVGVFVSCLYGIYFIKFIMVNVVDFCSWDNLIK